jgi:transposase, IS30 family
MKKREKLSKTERLEIGILLNKGYSRRSIARALERSPNTISYEIGKNSVRGRYDPHKAQTKAQNKRRYRRLQWRKIDHDKELKAFIIKKLEHHWNPDEIAGYIKKNQKRHTFYASKTAIYNWLRTAKGEQYCTYLYTKRKRVKKRIPKTKRVMIPNRVSIHKRFAGASNRTRYGHWETDSVVSRKGARGGLKVSYERKSRLVLARKVTSMKPSEHARVLKSMLSRLKTKTITYDNGIENRDYEILRILSFFADAYASWQKGGVENANKMLRRYFPKGTDFGDVTQEEIDVAVALINKKPRKSLGYRSALEVARAGGIIKDKGVLIEG